tara:strand:- start:1875 stop:2276 length:402 start_codon:yes stop_codon:yes gene_type:complete
MSDFLDQKAPCCASGYIQVNGKTDGAFILKTDTPSPSLPEEEFFFGYCITGFENTALYQFIFHFKNQGTLQTLLRTDSPLVNSVLYTMIENQAYYFILVNPDHSVTAFKSNLTGETLSTFTKNFNDFRNTPYS